MSEVLPKTGTCDLCKALVSIKFGVYSVHFAKASDQKPCPNSYRPAFETQDAYLSPSKGCATK